jgi:DNA polymerase I-like protein with 3'-5' exonuclease and polymerase domains
MQDSPTTTSQSYLILNPVKSEPRPVDAILVNPNIEQLEKVWPTENTLAIDFETKGTDASHPEFQVIGLGVASASRVIYVHIVGLSSECTQFIKSKLEKADLTAFNVMFDAAALYSWLGIWANWKWCSYGLFKQLASEGFVNQRWNLEEAQYTLLSWPESQKDIIQEWLLEHGFGTGTHPDKSQMWRVPSEILGPYCAADADAAWQLLNLVFIPYLDHFAGLKIYHERYFITLIRLLIEQQFNGVAIDVPQLVSYNKQLVADIAKERDLFLHHPQVYPHVQEFQQAQVDEHKKKEPKATTKKGDTSKNWIKWNDKLKLVESTTQFNLNSDQQLRWLFYDRLRYPIRLRTESGQPAISGKVLPALGEAGKVLIGYNDLTKEQGYVQGCLEFHRDGIIHVQMKPSGTLTGRSAGTGGLNIQQIPHSEGYMKTWVARPGCVWVDCDFTALEPTVLAELSEDPTLMKLYGPDAKPNDIYLFNGAHIRGLKETIRKYYNPDFPTKESIKLAKEKCKRERSISKVITLASSYGAGVNKLYETLTLSGIDVNFDEVKEMRDSYWHLYQGILRYQDVLNDQWQTNQGFVYNGLARPLAVAPELTKDLVNRVVQSTGHEILTMYLYFIDQLRIQRRVDFIFVIADFHDETIVECKEEDGPKVMQLFNDALELTNQELNGIIKLKANPVTVKNLWQAKGD